MSGPADPQREDSTMATFSFFTLLFGIPGLLGLQAHLDSLEGERYAAHARAIYSRPSWEPTP